MACDPEIKGSIYSQAQCYRALIFWLNGERSRARETLKETFLQSPEDAFIYFWLGYMAHENGDRNEAGTCFARAEALMPDIYQMRKGVLLVEDAGRLSTLRKDQVRVATLYCKTPDRPPAATAIPPETALEIRQVKVVPNPVAAGDPFDIEIAYIVSDPSASAGRFP